MSYATDGKRHNARGLATQPSVSLADAERILDSYRISDTESRAAGLAAAERTTSPQPLRMVVYDADRLRRWCQGDC